MRSRRRSIAQPFLTAGTVLILSALLLSQSCAAAAPAAAGAPEDGAAMGAGDSGGNTSGNNSGDSADSLNPKNDVWSPEDAGAMQRRFGGAGAKNKEAPPVVEFDKKTFADAVKKLEQRVFGHANTSTDPEATLARMESFVLGMPQSGPLQSRLERVEAVLDGRQAASSDIEQQSVPEKDAADKAEAGQKSKEGAGDAAAGAGPTGSAANGQSASQSLVSAQVLRGRIDKLASNYALAGITMRSNALPSEIMVKPGSRALRAGVMDHDKLIHAELGVDTLQLVVQRDGRKFVLEVPLSDSNKAAKLAVGDTRLNSGAAANGTFTFKGTAQDDWKILKQYNIAVLLDVSGSMGEMQSEVGMTKHDWCLQQITSFAAEAQRLGSGTFDLGTFSSDYSLIPNCTAAQAVAQLSANAPHGGTDIATPLQAAINTRYTKSTSKPFLVVVITDGIPGTGEPLDSLIVRASRQARSAGDIKIIFLQIGRGPGRILADFLDTQLVGEGAPYDIVSSIEWDQLSQIGLRSGLIAALRKPSGPEVVVDPEKIMQFDRLRNSLALSKQRFDYRQNMQQQRQMMRNARPGGLTPPYFYP